MAASLKQKWLRILTDIAENAEDYKVKLEAIRLSLEVQSSQKPGKHKKTDEITDKLAGILSSSQKA
jgi:hypothetical protein